MDGEFQPDVLHKRFHRVDLAAVDFESFPDDQRIALRARGTGAEIKAEQNDAAIFVNRRDAIRNSGQRGNLLRFYVFAVRTKRAARAGHEASVLEAISVPGEWSINRDKATGL